MSGGYEVVICQTCGLVFADTAVSKAQVDAFYCRHSKYGHPETSTGGASLSWDTTRLSATAERIAQYLPDRDSHILDIGCAGGGLLASLKKLGYAFLCGVDPSPACLELVKRFGIGAFQGTLSELPDVLVPGSFDCIILSHVLEHLLIPSDAVIGAFRLLKPGGILYAEVPDASRYEAFLTAPFQEFNTEHVNHFSQSCLCRLFMAGGFQERFRGRTIINASANTLYPAIYAVYEKRHGTEETPHRDDDSLRMPMERYIQQSHRILERMKGNLKAMMAGNPEIILWGAGQLAMKLLGENSLAEARIVAIVDGNPVHHGLRLRGLAISAPEQIRGMKNPILIASVLHEAEISQAIRCHLGMDNPIWSLLTEGVPGAVSESPRAKVDPQEDMEALFAENPVDARCRADNEFPEWLERGRGPLVLFGAGGLGGRVLECLRRDGIEPACFADNNPAKQGKNVNGLQVFSPEEAIRKFHDASFVVTIRSPGHGYRDSQRQLLNEGCERVLPVLPVLWKYRERLLPHYGLDRPEFFLAHTREMRRAFSLLADGESRRLFTALLRMRMRADLESLPLPSPSDQYFAEGVVRLSHNEFFVDCGTYDDDTIRSFLARRRGSFRRILAFEPDPANGEVLCRYVESLPIETRSRITIRQEAVGACRGRVQFNSTGSGGSSISEEGCIEVDVVSLDEVFGNDCPTFIKLDVEGAEQDALAGARDVIRRFRPLLAVCVYHRPDDLWRIPLYLQAMDAGYRFHLRAHENDGLDTVLYALPGELT